jgi:hypothetical protein
VVYVDETLTKGFIKRLEIKLAHLAP